MLGRRTDLVHATRESGRRVARKPVEPRREPRREPLDLDAIYAAERDPDDGDFVSGRQP